MHYAAYITRAGGWSFEDRESQPISEPEWCAYAEGDAEPRPLASLPLFDVSGAFAWNSPVERTWEWVAHPRRDPLRPATFEYDSGGVIVRAPDPELVRKALAVAGTLGAKLIRDDGGVLGSCGDGTED